jgi:FixJ family two-component response regulator
MKQVIVLDDDKAFLESIKNILQAQGIKVSTYVGQMTAMKKVFSVKDQPGVTVVSDYLMPNVSGIEFLNCISCYSNVKRVLISSYIPDFNSNWLQKYWFIDDVLSKPLNIEALLKII